MNDLLLQVDPAAPAAAVCAEVTARCQATWQCFTVACGRCRRTICSASRAVPASTRKLAPAALLPQEHYCRWCSCPITETARAKVPTAFGATVLA